MAASSRLSKQDLTTLADAAKSAASRAYAPYSSFTVGAAILMESGKVFSGANVENASYGLTQCAERTAICSAVASGELRLRCVVVYTPTAKPTAPCGACRQVIREFGPDCKILSVCDGKEVLNTTIKKLLPSAFGPDSL